MSAYTDTIQAFRRQLVAHTLAAHGGNRVRTARALGMQRTYLCRLIRQLKIDAPRTATRSRRGYRMYIARARGGLSMGTTRGSVAPVGAPESQGLARGEG